MARSPSSRPKQAKGAHTSSEAMQLVCAFRNETGTPNTAERAARQVANVFCTPREPSMASLAPIDPHARIHAIDAVRGFALLGIFMVNILLFGEPFGEMMRPSPAPEESTLDGAAFYFVKSLCESKFYPLFSMLFGMGLILQWQRATA